MALKREKSFAGGYKFGTLSGTPPPEIVAAPIPDRVFIPLQHRMETPVKPTVKAGQTVRAGQIIGVGHNFSSPIHSSVNGKIISLANNRIEIKSDGTKDCQKIEVAGGDLESKSPDEIARALYLAGVTSLARYGIPSKYNSSSIAPQAVNNIIINAAEAEPFLNNSNQVFLKDNSGLEKFVTGLKILRLALYKVNVHVCVNRNDKKLISELNEKTRELDWLEIHPVSNKFPAGHNEILVEMILRRRVPYGAHATNIGVIVLDLQAVFAACSAVVAAEPMIERIVALSGPAFEKNIYLKIRLGVPYSEALTPYLKKGIKARFVLGSLMHGRWLTDLSQPVTKSDFQVIGLPEKSEEEFISFMRPGLRRGSYARVFLSALFPRLSRECDTGIHGELRPCIQCNYCSKVCPRPLYPHLLSKCVKMGFLEEAQGYEILACIECGLCSYVCPSKIHLMKDIEEGKKKVYGKEKGTK